MRYAFTLMRGYEVVRTLVLQQGCLAVHRPEGSAGRHVQVNFNDEDTPIDADSGEELDVGDLYPEDFPLTLGEGLEEE